MDWHKIDSAPAEHGARFLIWIPGGLTAVAANIYEACRFDDEFGVSIELADPHGFHDTLAHDATHWSPLPPPPLPDSAG